MIKCLILVIIMTASWRTFMTMTATTVVTSWSTRQPGASEDIGHARTIQSHRRTHRHEHHRVGKGRQRQGRQGTTSRTLVTIATTWHPSISVSTAGFLSVTRLDTRGHFIFWDCFRKFLCKMTNKISLMTCVLLNKCTHIFFIRILTSLKWGVCVLKNNRRTYYHKYREFIKIWESR